MTDSVIYELGFTHERFANSSEVYDAVLLGRRDEPGAPEEYATDFSLALATDFLITPNNRVIVSKAVADKLDAVGPPAQRVPVRLVESDINRRPIPGGRTNDEYVALTLPQLAAALDYTRSTATPKSVCFARPSKNPVFENERLPGIFYYGMASKRYVCADAVPIIEAARGVEIRSGRGLRKGDGRTPVMQAIARGEPISEFAEPLDVLARDAHDFTALHFAAEAGRSDWVDALVEAGADVDARNARQMTPLMVATYRGQTAVVDRLLQLGADPAAQDRAGWTVGQWAAYRGHNALTLRFRGVEGAPDAPSPFLVASLRRNESLASELIATGEVSAESLNNAVATALSHSRDALSPRAELADAIGSLLAQGADLSAVAGDELNLLRLATYQGRLDLVRALVERGIDVDLSDAAGETVLARVASWRINAAEATPIIEALLELGADPTFAQKYESPVERARRVVDLAASDAYAPAEQLAAVRANLDMLERSAAERSAE